MIPVYNESECIDMLYQRLVSIQKQLACRSELVFINDGSTDDTLARIKKLQESDPSIGIIDLSRNYGKEIAMSAGIDHINGDALVILDADLQDPPELIPEMLKEIENGYDDVYAVRSSRDGETWLKKFSSKLYYKLMEKFSDIPIQKDTGDFRMLSKRSINALKELKENERNMKGLFSFIGFYKKPVYYNRDCRIAGNSKWNYFRLFELAIKGLTSFSTLPLRLVSFVGIVTSLCAFVYLVRVLLKALFWGDPVAGYPSLMCSILFVGGFILLALGIIGEYLGIVYKETKKRPLYYVNENISSFQTIPTETSDEINKLLYSEKK
jgi:Glycosyltransferases involved in cell wall biogenesis